MPMNEQTHATRALLMVECVPFIRTSSKGRPKQAEIPSVLILVQLLIPGDMDGKIVTTTRKCPLCPYAEDILFNLVRGNILNFSQM